MLNLYAKFDILAFGMIQQVGTVVIATWVSQRLPWCLVLWPACLVAVLEGIACPLGPSYRSSLNSRSLQSLLRSPSLRINFRVKFV